jgi:glutamate synthase (NADPH) large chain
MVDLETPMEEDIEWIKDKIQQHAALTNSRLAQRILANWQKEQHAFVKVMPHDLKKVMQNSTETKLQEVA